MTKHYVLTLNPSAKYEWDRCTLHDPITADKPELAELVADAVGGQSGAYLVSIEIQVKVLEQVAAPTVRSTLSTTESSTAQPTELVA
ncbi:MAG: hypothetical protein HC881_20365 [Leptolyngbyaceae cyanobacterium SL_7_1]|nr:hypothetical protein [Leptolyngbyaceae cyanobacterium SL_7_1]